MRAIQITATGGPEVLVPTTVAEPVPGPGELLVSVAAAGVNYIDTYYRTGQYPVELPSVPGLEGAGVVQALGADVTDFAVGDRVAWCSAPGSYAEQVVVPASAAVAVPAGVPDDQAASALLQGMTAHYLLTSTYPAQPGDTVLLHAGAGGVGLMLTQLAVAAGVTVITTVSTDAKAELSRTAGAAHVLRYGDDLAAQVRELTAGEGVAAVYDGVGAATFDASLAALRVRGTLALFGAASGPVPPVDPQRLNAAGSLYLTRPTLAHYTRNRPELTWRADAVFGAVVDGSLRVRVGATYPLSEAAQAHRDLQARSTTGSLVLLPEPSGRNS
ncbi:quinone oxidoreductase [Rhodococcus sp. X156]|uniref:quinone oxidoreductase family protein n=1 Tax=Rhodococcus sp. X156 TaxID=2499145 RepID=UPI000FDC2115|nr:quinone oxidoreductase [Rhodococcus sp. X156]